MGSSGARESAYQKDGILKNKILIIDIETRPALAYVWGLYDQTISLNQLVSPSAPICFAAKFVGEKTVHFYSEWGDGREVMIKKAHELLSEADAVVGYNSDSFDLRKLRGEFLLSGLTPPPPLTSIDLLKSVKRLGFQSNKLAYIGPLLNIGKKVKHAGFELWIKVLEGDTVAQRKMEKYNIGDVTLTESLYLKLLPFISNHPHLGSVKHECGACGSDKVQSRGYRRTKHYRIQRTQCTSCGSWGEGTRTKLT